MKVVVALVALAALTAGDGRAADGPAPPQADACLMLNNRILGPRSETRPLPLMRETAEHTFTPACSVPWSTISPKNEAVPVAACFKGSLLQIPNDSACGNGTGKLWVGARWVVTSADLAQVQQHAAICQKLETGAWAGTRALTYECQPRTRELAGFKADDKAGKPEEPPPKAAATPDHP